MIKGMNKAFGFFIAFVCMVVPTVVVFMCMAILISPAVGLYAAVTWLAFYIVWNIGIVKQQEWQCIERLGQYHSVKLGGIRFYCAFGIIDKVKASGNFLEMQHKIFVDTNNKNGGLEVLDFVDGSAPIEGYMWFKIGNEVGNNKKAVIDYVYTSKDPAERAVQIAEDHLRPEFQKMSIDDVSRDRTRIIVDFKKKIGDEIALYGLCFAKETPIVIADIGLTDEIKRFREERMRGKGVADEKANEAVGYRRAIQAIMYDDDGNKVCDFETAATIWREQQTREMFGKTGSNITIMGGSATDVLKTFDMTPKGTK